jgi:hypothetical protein
MMYSHPHQVEHHLATRSIFSKLLEAVSLIETIRHVSNTGKV